jgi:hypothetical protein
MVRPGAASSSGARVASGRRITFVLRKPLGRWRIITLCIKQDSQRLLHSLTLFDRGGGCLWNL